MKRVLLLLFLVGLPAASSAQTPSVLSIVNVTVIDVTEGSARAHRTVVVRNGKIEDVLYTPEAKGKAPGLQINGTGKFLIPGLWDMHVHTIFGDWFPRAKEITRPLFIANGVTGVRDMGSDLDALQQLRNEISAGTLVGPRIVMSGPMLDGPQPRFPASIAIKTPEDGRRAVDELKKHFRGPCP